MIEKLKKKVLIITSSIDLTTDYIIDLYKNKVDFYRMDVDNFSEYEIIIGDKNDWIIYSTYWKSSLKKKDLYSIYYRKPRLPDLSSYEYVYQNMIAKDIITLINGIVDDFDGKVLTKPYILRKTENKIFQLLYAKRNGFTVPKSFIGNSNEAAKIYSGKKSIIKPISIGKVNCGNEVEIYQTSYLSEIEEDISLTPVYLQNYIYKNYEIRMTYINGCFFPVRIDSKDKLDWRKNYSGHVYSIVDCPKDIINKCNCLLDDFDLKFGAFDFIVNENGEWVFLEVNPNGQWQWLEQALKLPISEKIIEYLIN